MTDLARMTTSSVAIDRAIELARLQALDEFATASVEEIMLKAAEKRLAMLEARRRLVLHEFDATDVANLGGKLAKNKFAAEKLLEIFGGSFELLKDTAGKPLSDVQVIRDDPDVGEYRIYTYFGRYTRPDGKVVEQMGSFSTKDAFFAKDTKREGGEWKGIDEINLVDVMVAAQTETFKKCIFRGCGLGDWSEAESETLRGSTRGHDFSGSQAGTGEKDAVVGFGKSKGTKVVDLIDADLAWYAKAYTANVADPDRAAYKKMNQRVLDALRAEQERRAHAASHEAETGTKAEEKPKPAPHVEAPAPSPRGKKIGDAYARLHDISNGDTKVIAGMLRLVTKDVGKETAILSDVSDEVLDKLLAAPENVLTHLAAQARGGKEEHK